MDNIAKLKIEERIKLSYIRNRGMISDIVEDLNLPEEYVRKIVSKIKKQESLDVANLISNTLMQHILLGYESRVKHLMDSLKLLNTEQNCLLSVCCNYVTNSIVIENKSTLVCIKCNQLTSGVKPDSNKLFRLKNSIIEQLRNEDQMLIEMADKMGYTQKQVLPPSPIYQQNNTLIVTGGNNGNKLSSEDKTMIEDVAKLEPMEREKLRKDLEQRMLNMQTSEIKRELPKSVVEQSK